MKIAYLVNQYPQPSQTFIRREIAAIEQAGNPVSRFTLRRYAGPLPDSADQAERDKTYVIIETPFVDMLTSLLWALLTRPAAFFQTIHASLTSCRDRYRSPLLPIAYFLEACILARILIKGSVDHLHAHFGTNSAAVARLVRLLGGPPYSFTCHGPEEFDRPDALGLGDKVHEAAFAVTVSDFGRSQLCRWSSASDWEKIHVVRCGLDDSFLSVSQTSVPSATRLLCVGRLDEQKGHHILVQAAAIVARSHPNFELLLVGDGPLRASISQAVERLNLSTVVKFLGWKSNLEIRDLLLKSRGLVISSFAEGLPVVIMESLALGRPVIATQIMAIPELVQPTVTGWLVPPADPDALAAAMTELITADASILTTMGTAGRILISSRHNASAEAGRLVELIQFYHSRK